MAETPEPYELIVGESSTQIHSDDGVIAEFSCCDHEANARRWLACINALVGWPTEALEELNRRGRPILSLANTDSGNLISLDKVKELTGFELK